jgi:hypothetical protein
MWTTDQLASLARARTSTQADTGTTQQRALAAAPASGLATPAGASEAPATAGMPHPGPAASQALLAPGLAAFGKIAMSITMGYMLILML